MINTDSCSSVKLSGANCRCDSETSRLEGVLELGGDSGGALHL
jgi:hypothetical protein